MQVSGWTSWPVFTFGKNSRNLLNRKLREPRAGVYPLLQCSMYNTPITNKKFHPAAALKMGNRPRAELIVFFAALEKILPNLITTRVRRKCPVLHSCFLTFPPNFVALRDLLRRLEVDPVLCRAYEGSPKRHWTFFFNLLLYLQLNQTCLLQSTPLYCWYTAPSDFFQFWSVFCGMVRRSCSEFSFISSTVWNRRPFRVDFKLGTGKSPQGPNLESRGAGARKLSLASPKIQG